MWIGGFDGEVDAFFLVNFFNNNRHLVAFFQHVAYFVDSEGRDFRDVH